MGTTGIRGFNSGFWEQQFEFKSFFPSEINHSWLIDSEELSLLLSEADRKLGELNAFGSVIPDVDFFIRMHIAKEATLSSRIEGTQTSFGDALLKEHDIDPEKRDDWSEVQNYIQAINFAVSQLEHLPLSNRLLKQTHFELMKGVRGKHKLPGEFRTSQNWIGGATIKDAAFIPPDQKHISGLMSDLEKFLHNENIRVPHLVKIGIAHYQFETIHPFQDGNGRLGRLLITLYLVSSQLLIRPSLYLSHFFEKNKSLYYDNLMKVRLNNDLHQWLKFFLVGVKETSENSIETFRKIIRLKEYIENEKLPLLGQRMKIGKRLLKVLYKQPIVSVNDVAEQLETTVATAYRLISEFEKLNILKEKTGFKRNRVFVFNDYLALFEE